MVEAVLSGTDQGRSDICLVYSVSVCQEEAGRIPNVETVQIAGYLERESFRTKFVVEGVLAGLAYVHRSFDLEKVLFCRTFWVL